MILRGTDCLADAARAGTAIGGFTAYNLETARAICDAGRQAGTPVLIQTGAASLRRANGAALARLAVTVAHLADTPVGVHLDHSHDVDQIRECIDLGYSSVMYDGSHLPFDENVDTTREVVALAHAAGVWVEAELGAVAGDEDRSVATEAGAYTEPAEARRFAETTGVDALAVAVGNVHGVSTAGAHVDVAQLRRIAAVCPVPLVLHGASGVPRETLREAIAAGVVKLNVNTELRRAFIAALAARIAGAAETHDVASLMEDAQARVATLAAQLAAEFARPADATTNQEGGS